MLTDESRAKAAFESLTDKEIEAAKIALVAFDYSIEPGHEQSFLDATGRDSQYRHRATSALVAARATHRP